jgi:Ca2+-binding EF-hand superfamily protein
MPLSPLFLPFFAAALASDEPITVVAHPWAPFISPMGEPFRARDASDNTLARWFDQADTDRDGSLTPVEMRADAERFFATLDRDHDGQILPEEMKAYEWEVAPEIQLDSRWKQVRGEPSRKKDRRDGDGRRRDDGSYDGSIDRLQGAARYALLNIPQPVASADTDFNRAVTLDEFRNAAQARFNLLDHARQNRLTLTELMALVPTRPKFGRRARPKKDTLDQRIAQPVPTDD